MTDTLKEDIEKLQELQGLLQRVRAIPPGVLMGGKVREDLRVAKEIGEAGLSEGAQAALHRAQDSLSADGRDVGMGHRREKRRARAATPVREDRKASPAAEEGVKMEGLAGWAREFNERHEKSKLRMRERVLRLTVEDVMTVYMGIGAGADNAVQIETIRACGPREKMGPHGQSRFAVYQQLTQQLGSAVEGRTLQGVVRFVLGYSDMFVSRCGLCGRVVSQEGHVPAVVRRRDGTGAEHVSCVIGGQIG